MERKREGEKGGGRGKEGNEQRKERNKQVATKKQAWQEGHKKTGDKPEKQVCSEQVQYLLFYFINFSTSTSQF